MLRIGNRKEGRRSITHFITSLAKKVSRWNLKIMRSELYRCATTAAQVYRFLISDDCSRSVIPTKDSPVVYSVPQLFCLLTLEIPAPSSTLASGINTSPIRLSRSSTEISGPTVTAVPSTKPPTLNLVLYTTQTISKLLSTRYHPALTTTCSLSTTSRTRSIHRPTRMGCSTTGRLKQWSTSPRTTPTHCTRLPSRCSSTT